MKKYAFFLDIDGTYSAGKYVPKENIEAIKKAQKAGHYVLINTGRASSFLPMHVVKSVDFDGFVCGLGADIKIHGEQIYSKTVPKDLVLKFAEIFLSIPEKAGFLEGEEHVYYTKSGYADKCGVQIFDAADFNGKHKDAKISKFTCETIEPDKLKELAEQLDIYEQTGYLELAIKGQNKASGMKIAADYLGVDADHCVAIGDSVNDEDMLRAAGIAVVMENGDEKMKKIADFITDTAENAGVAKAIYKITGIEP